MGSYLHRLPASRLNEDLAPHIGICRVIGAITVGNQDRGPSPHVLDGMGDPGRDGDAGDRTRCDEGVPHPSLVSEADQGRSLHGDHLPFYGYDNGCLARCRAP
jgi:hypothetical protein